MEKSFLDNKNIGMLDERLQPNIDTKFGLEIECGILNESDSELLKTMDGIKVKTDRSIRVGIPTEIVTPVYENTYDNIEYLKNLSNILKNMPIDFSTCSLQPNIDCDLNYEGLYNLLLIMSIYEKEIYRFSLGSDKALRTNIENYAASFRMYIKALQNVGYDEVGIVENLIGTKKWMLSFKCHKDENNRNYGPISFVEFRTPNGTADFELWMNYINTFYNIIRTSKRADTEALEYRFDKLNHSMCYESAYMENVDRVLEFVNLIFKTEEEKLYFLKQYFGYYNENGKERVLKLN